MDEYSLKRISLVEIVDYIRSHKGTSYYDIKEIAYSEPREGWILVLEDRKIRQCVAYSCRDQRRADHVPYNRPMHESSDAALTAEIAYREKHGSTYD